MTERHERIYRDGLQLTKMFKTAERGLVENFIQAEDAKIYREFDKPSMFQYATEVLGHSDATAYTLIHVARSAKRVPEFRNAVATNKLSVAKAGRIAAHVEKNKSLIEFAATHSKRETEVEVAKLNPETEPVNKFKMVGGGKVEMTVTVSLEAFEAIERAQALLAQKNPPATLSDAVEANAYQFVDRKDPVKIAGRNQSELCPGKVGELTAAEKHAVYNRDKGRCTHKNYEGKRCNSDRWVEVHHIIERQHGGTNDPGNLTTLCGFHHRRKHRGETVPH